MVYDLSKLQLQHSCGIFFFFNLEKYFRVNEKKLQKNVQPKLVVTEIVLEFPLYESIEV